MYSLIKFKYQLLAVNVILILFKTIENDWSPQTSISQFVNKLCLHETVLQAWKQVLK